MKEEKTVTERVRNVEDRGFAGVLLDELKLVLQNSKQFISMFILGGIWMAMPLTTGYFAKSNILIVRLFCALTYAEGGISGGFFGMVGGIFGKAVFAAVVNGLVLALWNRKNPFAGFRQGVGGLFAGGLEAVALLLIGGGIGMVAYVLFNITSAPQNCAIAVVCVLAAMRAVAMRNGLLFAGGFYLLKKMSKGRSPSFRSVSRLVTGLAAGFAMALPATFLRCPASIAGAGLLLVVAGVAISIAVKAKRNPTTAAMAAISLAFLPVTVLGDGTRGGNRLLMATGNLLALKRVQHMSPIVVFTLTMRRGSSSVFPELIT